MSSSRSARLLALVAASALFFDPSGAEAAGSTSLPPPIPTVTLGPTTPVTVTTTTVPPTTTAVPPVTTDPDRPPAGESRDSGPPPGLTGVAGVALVLAATATVLTWRRRVSPRDAGRR